MVENSLLGEMKKWESELDVNGIWATGYSYRIWILLHIIPFKSDIWTRSSLSLSLSLSVFLAHTNLMQLALTMDRFVCFYFLYCLLLLLFVFLFFNYYFYYFFCWSTRAARKRNINSDSVGGSLQFAASRLSSEVDPTPHHHTTLRSNEGQVRFTFTNFFYLYRIWYSLLLKIKNWKYYSKIIFKYENQVRYRLLLIFKVLKGPVNSTRDLLKNVQLKNVQNALPKRTCSLNKS